MSERAIHVGLLISAVAVAVWAFARPTPFVAERAREVRPEAHVTTTAVSPLALVPAGSAFVLSADIVALRRAPLGALLAQRLARFGHTDLTTLCGFDPLARLSELVVAVPSARDADSGAEASDDFGVIASGAFSAAEITQCASAAIAQRGGDAVQSTLGSFDSVRDRKHAAGEVAAKNGLLIVSGGNYFRELLDSADGQTPIRDQHDPRDARHVSLRHALGAGEIVASWLLADGWFERVSGEQHAELSPLGTLQALGARVQVGNDVRLNVLLQCADERGATKLANLLTSMRSMLGALGVSPALVAAAQRVVATPTGARLQLTLTLSDAELSALFDALPDSAAMPAIAH